MLLTALSYSVCFLALQAFHPLSDCWLYQYPKALLQRYNICDNASF